MCFIKFIIINDSFTAQKASYVKFALIQSEIILSNEDEICLYLLIENRLGYSFLFLFACLPHFAETYNKNIRFFLNFKNFSLFKKLGLIDQHVEFNPHCDYSPILKDNAGLITESSHIFKTVTEIPNEAPVKMNSKLAAIFISRAGEMYNNALEHSHGKVFGAKYFRNQKSTYCFSCYDTGIGIPNSVLIAKKEICNELDAFKWAMIDGNSSVNNGQIPRGIGLGLLKSFVRANEGVIRICSGKIFYIYKSETERFYELNSDFHGTLFEMDIIADNNREYILK